MSTIPAIASRTFHARTARVPSVYRVEAFVDLDFGVQLRQTFALDALDFPIKLEPELFERAKHCLVVLIGGKRLIVRPDPGMREEWRLLAEIPARVYLCEKVYGKPIGYIEHMPEIGIPVLELSPFLSWLWTERFDVDLVREVMNGSH